jgi:hypothetical protein
MGKDTHNAEDTKEVKRKRERKNSGTRRFQTHDRKRFPKTAILCLPKKTRLLQLLRNNSQDLLPTCRTSGDQTLEAGKKSKEI